MGASLSFSSSQIQATNVIGFCLLSLKSLPLNVQRHLNSKFFFIYISALFLLHSFFHHHDVFFNSSSSELTTTADPPPNYFHLHFRSLSWLPHSLLRLAPVSFSFFRLTLDFGPMCRRATNLSQLIFNHRSKRRRRRKNAYASVFNHDVNESDLARWKLFSKLFDSKWPFFSILLGNKTNLFYHCHH